MKRKSIVMLATLVLLTAFMTPVYATPLQRFSKKYFRINLMLASPYIEFSASEQTYVMHGFRSDLPWRDMTAAQKKEFWRTASFTLEIACEPVELPHRYYWIYLLEGDGYMCIAFYVVFKPGTFEPGTYTFTGMWYLEIDGVPFTHTETRYVTVT